MRKITRVEEQIERGIERVPKIRRIVFKKTSLLLHVKTFAGVRMLF